MEDQDNGPTKQMGNTFVGSSCSIRVGNHIQVENVSLDDSQVKQWAGWPILFPENLLLSLAYATGDFELSAVKVDWLCPQLSSTS